MPRCEDNYTREVFVLLQNFYCGPQHDFVLAASTLAKTLKAIFKLRLASIELRTAVLFGFGSRILDSTLRDMLGEFAEPRLVVFWRE